MIDEADNQAVLVTVYAGSAEEAQQWGQDCDRGTWYYLGVLSGSPSTMDQDAFNTMARNKDPVWYRE